MRTFIFALSLMTSTAFACPNLAGSYKECKNSKGESVSTDMLVTQKVQNRVTIYDVSIISSESQQRESEVYKTDGKPVIVKMEEAGMVFTTKTVSTCVGNSLHININMTLNGEAAGWSKVKVSKAGKQLIIDSEGFDGEQQTTDREICE